jgi:hypothetical protein
MAQGLLGPYLDPRFAPNAGTGEMGEVVTG